MKKIKEGLKTLTKEVRESRFNEGIMMNSIFNFKNKMTHKARNHLYDSIEENIEEKEFTEADLKKPNRRGSSDYEEIPVISPARLPRQLAEEKNNPYTNPYLDSDLSTTLGKVSKKNRKQINTDIFQLEPTQLVAVQEEENTTDTTREKSER